MTAPKNIVRNFYTYLWLRDDGTPYYVGKGTWGYSKRERCYRRGSPPLEFVITQDHESEESAYFAEMFLISFYGRKDLGTGCLINFTNGGEGNTGRRWSEESKHKASIAKLGKPNLALKGRKRSEELKDKLRAYVKENPIQGYDPVLHSERMSGSRNPMYGKKRVIDEQWRSRLSEGKRGRIHSEETRKKMSEVKGHRKFGIKPTHCYRGHEFTPENTWVGKTGSRFCLQCRRINHEASNLRKKIRREDTRCSLSV